mmetsp:Transcript_33943/g.133174  ORF Transcript_33943/g.133174 Transcript_33943/m.133174 type:complete len:92 (+) Transcript_33943:1591-1866(+)
MKPRLAGIAEEAQIRKQQAEEKKKPLTRICIERYAGPTIPYPFLDRPCLHPRTSWRTKKGTRSGLKKNLGCKAVQTLHIYVIAYIMETAGD